MNRILESSTSTGTGNFTLNGAFTDPAQGIVGTLAFSQRVPLNLYVPYMIEDAAGNWEKGKGYLLNATTLVRGYVLDNSLGNITKINFPAGAKKVYYPTESRAIGPDYLNNVVWNNSPGITPGGTGTMTPNRMLMTPHTQIVNQKVTAVGIRVNTAVADSRIKLVLYNLVRQVDSDSYNSAHPKAFEIGEVSGATTGVKIINTNFYLPEGGYMIGVVATHAVGLSGNNVQYQFNPVFWKQNPQDIGSGAMWQDGVNIDATPDVTFGALSGSGNGFTVTVGFRGYCV